MFQTGSFLVRRSRNNQGNPFTLLLIFEGNLFKLAIRRRDDGKLALGKESSGGEIVSIYPWWRECCPH